MIERVEVRRPLVAAALGTLAAWGLWTGLLARRWTDRVPRGLDVTYRFAGTQTYADSLTRRLPSADVLGEYERRTSVIDERWRPDSVTLSDRLTVFDVATGRPVWEYELHEVVDPRTGAWVGSRHPGEIVLFPRNVEKRTYVFRNNYVKGVPLRFQREEDIAGLRTYEFTYRGRGEYSESYAGTNETPGVPIGPGQELRCADDQFYLHVWVEPATGTLVKIDEGCPSGDYVYDLATGRALFAVDRWSGLASGTPLLARVAAVERERANYMFAARYLPLMLLVTTALLLALAARPRSAASA